MDPPLINESSFSTANPSSYSLAEIWPFPNGLANSGLNRDGSESTVTEQSGVTKRKHFFSSEDHDTSKLLSTSTIYVNNQLPMNDSKSKRIKVSGSRNENAGVKPEVEASCLAGNKTAEQSSKSEPPKDYIHVRARRGQATDSHSLAERARREKISERMKLLQDLVPGCNKVIGKALVLDEIINYIQSLQRQVEFLSMKLETVNSRMSMTSTIEGYHSKESFDATRMIFGSQVPREYPQGSQAEWLHMQIGGSFERST